jgi:hypothetical protein
VGGLAGDAEPGADLGPGVAEQPQAEDGAAERCFDFPGQGAELGDGVDVALAMRRP